MIGRRQSRLRRQNSCVKGWSDGSEVGVRSPHPPGSGGHGDWLMFKPLRVSGKHKLSNDLTRCLESFREMNINVKIIFPMLSPGRCTRCAL